jgi:type IV pilus assembly protein PilA
MTSWYYVDSARNRQGPVDAEAVAAAFRAGAVNDDSLVWREGLAQWAPLRQFRDELGMGPAMAPAPVAPVAPAPMPAVEPKKSNTGCLIAAVVGGVGGLALLAILAAIALPAYQDYIIRSKVAMAVSEGRFLSTAVFEYQATHGRCPTSFDELGGTRPTLDITLVSLGEDRCVIEIALEGLHEHRALQGRRVYLNVDASGESSCTSDLEQLKYLPSSCH